MYFLAIFPHIICLKKWWGALQLVHIFLNSGISLFIKFAYTSHFNLVNYQQDLISCVMLKSKSQSNTKPCQPSLHFDSWSISVADLKTVTKCKRKHLVLREDAGSKLCKPVLCSEVGIHVSIYSACLFPTEVFFSLHETDLVSLGRVCPPFSIVSAL